MWPSLKFLSTRPALVDRPKNPNYTIINKNVTIVMSVDGVPVREMKISLKQSYEGSIQSCRGDGLSQEISYRPGYIKKVIARQKVKILRRIETEPPRRC